MNCKNCGARMENNAVACPNCGAKVDESQYVLLTDEGRITEMEMDYAPRKKNTWKIIICVLLLIAILAGGGYFVASRYINPKKPEMSFTSGYGIINGDMPVIYVKIGENAQLEYIHGVKLFAYNKTESGNIGEELTSDYEYTKSVDGTFRAIFFDASDFHLESDKEYTYTFEMSLSFSGSTNVFVYNQAVEFPADITGDASDIVFDHSMDTVDDTTEPTTAPTTKPEESTSNADISFIYSSFWYMTPFSNEDSYTISSVKFEKDGKCSFTHFYKKGTSPWQVTTTNGTFEVKGNTVFVTDSEGLTESYTVDSTNKKLNGLEERKYNSTKNAEDFFGI